MPENSREHLISVASEMMYRRGYASVNVTEVVKTAGISRAQFYRLIDSKAALGAEVIARFAEKRQTMLDRALHAEVPIRGQIQRMFSLLQQEQLASHTEFGHCVGSSFARFAGEAGEDDAPLLAAVEAGYSAWRGRLAAALRSATERGEIQIPDPNFPASAIVAYAEGVLAVSRSANNPAVVRALAPAAMSLLIDRRATGAWPLILLSSGSIAAAK